jgi:hypothetical protein
LLLLTEDGVEWEREPSSGEDRTLNEHMKVYARLEAQK